jgi:hypothetical protein
MRHSSQVSPAGGGVRGFQVVRSRSRPTEGSTPSPESGGGVLVSECVSSAGRTALRKREAKKGPLDEPVTELASNGIYPLQVLTENLLPQSAERHRTRPFSVSQTRGRTYAVGDLPAADGFVPASVSARRARGAREMSSSAQAGSVAAPKPPNVLIQRSKITRGDSGWLGEAFGALVGGADDRSPLGNRPDSLLLSTNRG